MSDGKKGKKEERVRNGGPSRTGWGEPASAIKGNLPRRPVVLGSFLGSHVCPCSTYGALWQPGRGDLCYCFSSCGHTILGMKLLHRSIIRSACWPALSVGPPGEGVGARPRSAVSAQLLLSNSFAANLLTTYLFLPPYLFMWLLRVDRRENRAVFLFAISPNLNSICVLDVYPSAGLPRCPLLGSLHWGTSDLYASVPVW